MGFYMAPDDAQVTPVQIPEGIELIELITGGEVFFDTADQANTFGKGTIFWHRAGEHTIYRTTPEKPYRCIVFIFSVRDTARPVPRVSFWNADAGIDQFASECLNLYHSQTLDMDLLCLYVYSTLLRHAKATGGAPMPLSYPASLERAIQYIQNNIEKKISVDNLARHSKISQPQLFKLFQSYLNISPHKYILSQQLLRARTMLAGTSKPIKAIALQCGFKNLEVFYRRFRCESGMPPDKYRRKHLPYRLSQK